MTAPVAKVPNPTLPPRGKKVSNSGRKPIHRGRHPIPKRSSSPKASTASTPKINPVKQSPAVTPVTPPSPSSGGTTTVVDIKPKVPPRQPQEPVVTEGITPKNSNVKSGKSDVIIALMFGLIIVNGFSSGQFQDIAAVVTKAKKADTKKSHHGFMMLGGELVFMIGLSLIAKMGEEAANFVLVFVIALWTLWGVQNGTHIASFAKKVNG